MSKLYQNYGALKWTRKFDTHCIIPVLYSVTRTFLKTYLITYES